MLMLYAIMEEPATRKRYSETTGKIANSSYKHHTTMKCLIAVTPHGATCFVSDLYEGSIDNVTMFDQYGIMDHVNEGDAFLVDRGFTVQEILLRKQTTIFIPPFKGRDTLIKEEVLLTKSANSR